MEKKKIVKPLVIATAVAAVAGIGAVSFAAWSGADTDPVTKSGATGEISTLGALTVTADAASLNGENLKSLVPADQGTVTDCVNYWKFTLSCDDATGDATPSYKIEGSLTAGSEDGSTAVGGAKLYWLATAPNAATPETTNEITGTATALTPDANGVVYVYLVASGTDAMNATVSLTFSAE